MGECQSPETTDKCPYCVDSCDAWQYKMKYNSLLRENGVDEPKQQDWYGEIMECNICSYKWVAVYPLGTKALECPTCGNMQKLD